jgi:hypothetical protein
MEHLASEAAYQRLERAVRDSIKTFESDSYEDRWRCTLVRAVEVHAAAQQALQFSNSDPRIQYVIDHSWTKAAFLRVAEATWLNKELVAEMVREADAKHAALSSAAADSD